MSRKQVVGRQVQLDALDEAFRQTPDGGRFAVLTGAAGSGRTAVLAAAADDWQATGAVVLRMPPAPPGVGTIAGYVALLDVLREQYGQLANPLLAGPLSAIGALCAHADPPSPARLAVLAEETSAAFGLIGRKLPAVLIADDVDDTCGFVPALAAAVRGNCLVVAATDSGGGRLAALADLVVDLPPLDTTAVRQLLIRRHGVPVDDSAVTALATALGPLAGNPATLLETTAALVRAGRLVVVGGHLCLLDPQAPIPLPAGHPMSTATRRRGVLAERLATIAAITRFHVDDLPLFAAATRDRVDVAGPVLDGLVAEGVLVVGRDDVVRPMCPALAARLVADAGSGAVHRLHRAYVAAMLRRSGAGVPADRAALADHVTSAGGTLPTDRRTALALADAAVEAMDRDPDRAADWLDAALRHSGGGPAGEDILARLLRLLVRTGRFSRLGEVVRSAPAGHRGDLAAAGALAALHTAVPVTGVLRRPPRDWAVAALVDRWLTESSTVAVPPVGAPLVAAGDDPSVYVAGDEPSPLVTDAEFGLVARAVGIGWLPSTDADIVDQLLVAGSAGDLVRVFQLVLGGGRYRAPGDGPLAAYHRMMAARARGDLPGVVSAARQVGMTAGQAPVPRRLARLWAAEALALQSRAEEAAAWLDSVPDDPPYAALRWWVAAGPAGGPATMAEAERHLEAAYRACRRQLRYGSRIGVDRLLVRAAGLAARFGLPTWGVEITQLVEADLAADQPPAVTPTAALTATATVTASPGTGGVLDRGTRAMVRALSTADPSAVAEAVDAVRARHDRVEFGYAALDLGRVVDEPRQWLLAALEVAEEIGAPWLRSATAEAMRARGVRRRRGPAHRTTLSPVESRIIELIRAGRTNRQIAVAIRMSEKTVENYLTRLFARTGCRSRVELAAASITSDTLDLAS